MVTSKRFICGSYLLGLNGQYSDQDFVCFSDEVRTVQHIHENDTNCYNPDFFRKILEFDKSLWCTACFMICNYQFDYRIQPEDFPIKYDFTKYIKFWQEYIQFFVRMHYSLLFRQQNKVWYHILYGYFINLNKSVVLTQHQLSMVKLAKCKKLSKQQKNSILELISGL